MFVDKLGDVLALMQLQRALAEFGTGSILAALLFGLTVVLAVDYARMLYLHFKMVSPIYHTSKGAKGKLIQVATWSSSLAHRRKHILPTRQQTLDLLRGTCQKV